MLRDILKGKDPQIAAIERVIAQMNPDVLVLQEVDYDHDLLAITALRDRIAQTGPDYPYIFALRPNTGMHTGLDMDGDGRLGDARDAQGYGKFSGQGGMAVFSRYPIDATSARDFSAMLWRDLPQAELPMDKGVLFPSIQAIAVQRLSTVGHWVVPINLGDRRVELLVFHATTPVFDGPEDRNGKRNHDEIRFWQHYLDGQFGPTSDGSFILIGDANSDPDKGESRKAAIQDLLGDKRLQDPRPMRTSQATQDAVPLLDTVMWPAPGPGELRVDYILPSADLTVIGSGVFWPIDGTDGAKDVQLASRHRLVWVDLAIPQPQE